MIRSLVRGPSLLKTTQRGIATKQLVFEKFGDPTKVLSTRTVEVDDNLKEDEILLEWMACPFNPADINMIQGVYPLKPTLPAVGGNEGVAKIAKVGSGVKNFEVGDWVIPAEAGIGTWRSHSVQKEQHVWKIPSEVGLHFAATALVNPPTAYRMLKDFKDLEPGDVVVQNGANSGVGRAVIQIAKELGIQTINIVRDRPTYSALDDDLRSLGADAVLTEELFRGELLSYEISLCQVHPVKKLSGKWEGPKLALNCVGGRSTLHMVQYLMPRGKMVTYGAMSRMPFQVPTSPMIFREIECHGFWMSKWYTFPEHQEERRKMMDFLTDMVRRKRLLAPDCDELPLESFKEATDAAVSGTGRKQLLVMSK